MPAHVKNLFVEVDLIRIGFLSHACALTRGTTSTAGSLLRTIWTCCIDRCWYSDLLGFECRFISLKNNFGLLLRIGGVDHEVIVVGACHHIATVARKDDLEFVKDAIVLVGVTKSGSEVFVDWNCLYWLLLHVDIPDFDREIITREYVASVMRESDIRYGRDDF